MNYEFPRIETLDDVLPAIAGRDEFKVMERSNTILVDYLVNFKDTFPDVTQAPDEETRRLWIMRRECRGLIFDRATRKILSRRLHKFFNVGEREETLPEKVNLSRPHRVLTKLDGSMISAYVPSSERSKLVWDAYMSSYEYRVYWGSMMGSTDMANMVTNFVGQSNVDYTGFALSMFLQGITPIFEWMSRVSRIVVDYPSDSLVLIAARHLHSGQYLHYDDMVARADYYGVPVVESWGSQSDIDGFLTRARAETAGEGYVIRFDDGHMTKVKNEWYLRVHKTKELLVYEKDVLALILNEKLDDVRGQLDQGTKDRVEAYERSIQTHMGDLASYLSQFVQKASQGLPEARREAKKIFHLERGVSALDKRIQGLVHRVFDGHDPMDVVREFFLDHTSTQTTVDSIREYLGPAY